MQNGGALKTQKLKNENGNGNGNGNVNVENLKLANLSRTWKHSEEASMFARHVIDVRMRDSRSVAWGVLWPQAEKIATAVVEKGSSPRPFQDRPRPCLTDLA